MAQRQLWRKGDSGSFGFSKKVCCIFLIICVSTLLFWAANANRKNASPAVSKHIQYSFTLQNKTNCVQKNTDFWTYAPISRMATQTQTHLTASHPYRLSVDPMGNQILHFLFDEIPPYSTKVILIDADLLLNGEAAFLEQCDLKSYLIPAPLMESGDKDIQSLARQLMTDNPLSTARNIFSWVVGNIRYTGYRSEPLGARYALETKSGDCTEFACLFVALCRANHIPARPVGGYVCKNSQQLNPADYHNWAEFHVNGAWCIADPQAGRFMENETDYIAFCRIGEPEESTGLGFQRYRVTGDGIRVKMK
ncbi:MAG: transglutaminase-like domain-containing protein [Pseudomonadota bacterium]